MVFLGFFFFFFFAILWHTELPYMSCPGIELVPPSVEAQSLNHWTTREVLLGILKMKFFYEIILD